jgi:hypothetical protein
MLLKKSIRDGSFLWFGLVLLIALCIAFLLPVYPEDFWWYVRVGQQTLASGAIPGVDTFTYSAAGQAFFNHSWGSAVIFWLTYHLGGLTLIGMLRGIVIGATYFLVWLTARKAGAGRIGSSLILLLAVLASSNNWTVRPQLLAYPLFALSLWILYQWQEGSKKIIWWLVPIALLWGNLHASFVMLVLLVLAALVFGKGDRRMLLFVFIGILAAVCINPRGWHTWEYVYQSLVLPSNQNFSTEWMPPVNQGWQMNLFFFWLLTFPMLAIYSPRKLSGLEWSWYAGFGFMALWGLRYGIWFILILAILTAELLADWEKRWLHEPETSHFGLNLAIPLAFMAASLAFLPGLREQWWQDAPVKTADTPVAAADWLQKNPQLSGPFFSEMGFSSYLEFALPERPVWIDTRMYLFPTTMWEEYSEIDHGAWNWEQLLDSTGANLAMISVTKQPKLVKAMEDSKNWCQVYQDEVAQIYARGGCSQ